MQVWFSMNPILLNFDNELPSAVSKGLLKRHSNSIKSVIVTEFMSIVYDPYAQLKDPE